MAVHCLAGYMYIYSIHTQHTPARQWTARHTDKYRSGAHWHSDLSCPIYVPYMFHRFTVWLVSYMSHVPHMSVSQVWGALALWSGCIWWSISALLRARWWHGCAFAGQGRWSDRSRPTLSSRSQGCASSGRKACWYLFFVCTETFGVYLHPKPYTLKPKPFFCPEPLSLLSIPKP